MFLNKVRNIKYKELFEVNVFIEELFEMNVFIDLFKKLLVLIEWRVLRKVIRY